jgi:peptidyl-prolyl cis-trans isomerase D
VLEKGPESKKVKIAILSKKIAPSAGTVQSIYSQAVSFAGKNNTAENFNASIAEQGLTKRYADEVQEFQKTITGLESPREMIRWAFNAEIHNVSGVFEFGNKYVVAMVADRRESGIAPLEQVSAEIELEVKKLKKSDIISSEMLAAMTPGGSFEDLARSLGLPVQEASQVSFSAVSIPAAGIEPNVIAAASVLDENSISEPISGNNGVYLIRINKITDTETGTADTEKSRMMMMRQSQANFEAYDALQKASNIEDHRSKFF